MQPELAIYSCRRKKDRQDEKLVNLKADRDVFKLILRPSPSNLDDTTITELEHE